MITGNGDNAPKSHKAAQIPRRDRELIEKRLAELVARQKGRR